MDILFTLLLAGIILSLGMKAIDYHVVDQDDEDF
jgi:hypothetical protein